MAPKKGAKKAGKKAAPRRQNAGVKKSAASQTAASRASRASPHHSTRSSRRLQNQGPEDTSTEQDQGHDDVTSAQPVLPAVTDTNGDANAASVAPTSPCRAPTGEDTNGSGSEPNGHPQPAVQETTAGTLLQNGGGDGQEPRGEIEASHGGEQDAREMYKSSLVSQSAESHIRFRDNNAVLNLTLEVKQAVEGAKYLLGYRLDAWLTIAGGKMEHAGYIDSWRVAKATAAQPEANDNGRNELLKIRVQEATEESSPGQIAINEIATCIQALWNGQGNFKRPTKKECRQSLEEEALIFIQMVYVSENLQRGGLLGHMMAGYLTLLGQLPEWFAFRGAVVLIPARPAGDAGMGWTEVADDDEDEYYRRLVAAYERCGFEMWCENSPVKLQGTQEARRADVMGRLVRVDARNQGREE